VNCGMTFENYRVEVVDAVLKLIAAPAGQRSLRTVVGIDFGTTTLNGTSSGLAAKVLASLGLAYMENVNAASGQAQR